jgi:predicted O-methyltransferase YrrM
MDEKIDAVLARYDARAAREAALMREIPPEETMRRVDEFLISIGPETGTLVNLLIKGAGARSILEIGTSYGHSTIYLAEAARMSGGKVVSIDLNAEKQRHARAELDAAGLGPFAEFVTGDARELIASLPGPFDFVLIDLWKDLYIPCFDLVYPKLADGGLIVADNILLPEFWRSEMTGYRRHVRSRAGIESVLLQVGSGIELSRYAGETARLA